MVLNHVPAGRELPPGIGIPNRVQVNQERIADGKHNECKPREPKRVFAQGDHGFGFRAAKVSQNSLLRDTEMPGTAGRKSSPGAPVSFIVGGMDRRAVRK